MRSVFTKSNQTNKRQILSMDTKFVCMHTSIVYTFYDSTASHGKEVLLLISVMNYLRELI